MKNQTPKIAKKCMLKIGTQKSKHFQIGNVNSFKNRNRRAKRGNQPFTIEDSKSKIRNEKSKFELTLK